MRDGIFAEPRLAGVYDLLEGDRVDLPHYLAIAAELGASSVLDVGCGTGSFACLLAGRGFEVTGLDPAAASLDIARAKPGAQRVRWIHGDVASLPALDGDLVSTRRTYVFAADGATLTSEGTRRYPPRAVIEDSLVSAGYALADARGAPDRPGRELVFIARKPAGAQRS